MPWAKYDVMVRIILAMIATSSIQIHRLAVHFQSEAKTASCVRRIQRFFAHQYIPVVQIVRVILALIPLPSPFMVDVV